MGDTWSNKSHLICRGSARPPLATNHEGKGYCSRCRRVIGLHRDGTIRPHFKKSHNQKGKKHG